MGKQTLESLLGTWACVFVSGFVLLNPPWFVFVSELCFERLGDEGFEQLG